MEFVSAVRGLGVSSKHSKHNDDLFVDRLNHRYTVAIIVLFSMVVTISQYGGEPINCWVPGHFTGNYAKYADNICWVSSTYNVPLNEDIPHSESDRKVKMLKYYQWTPFILLFQALLFYLPRMIWRSLNDKSGLDIQSIVNAVYDYDTDASKYGDREKLINYLINSFDQYVNSGKIVRPNGPNNNNANFNNDSPTVFNRRRNIYSSDNPNNEDNLISKKRSNDQEISSDSESENDGESASTKQSKFKRSLSSFSRFAKTLCITKGKRYGNYLLALFVFCRVLYTINSIAQLFILNHFLGNDYWLLGFEVIGKIWSGDDWTQLKRFPRVTMCDFRIREVGIVHRYTVQCVLSINLFNEKIFIFLWFWLCLVSFFNLFDLVSWCYTLIINSHERYTYIKRRLTALNTHDVRNGGSFGYMLDTEDRRLFKKFVNQYLKEDGVLALRLLSRNAHDLIVSEIVATLFGLYKNQQKQQQLQQHELKKLYLSKQQQRNNPITDYANELNENENNRAQKMPRYGHIKSSEYPQSSKSTVGPGVVSMVEAQLLNANLIGKQLPQSEPNSK